MRKTQGGGTQSTRGLVRPARTPLPLASGPSLPPPWPWRLGGIASAPSQGPGLANQNIPSRSIGSRGNEEIDQGHEMQPHSSGYSS